MRHNNLSPSFLTGHRTVIWVAPLPSQPQYFRLHSHHLGAQGCWVDGEALLRLRLLRERGIDVMERR